MRSWIRSKDVIAAAVGTLGLAAGVAVGAAPCAALQYEEMKDMSVEELSKEYCKAMRTSDNNIVEVVQQGLKSDDAAIQTLRSEAAQCKNEGERITRVMVRKGETAPPNWYKALCNKG